MTFLPSEWKAKDEPPDQDCIQDPLRQLRGSDDCAGGVINVDMAHESRFSLRVGAELVCHALARPHCEGRKACKKQRVRLASEFQHCPHNECARIRFLVILG